MGRCLFCYFFVTFATADVLSRPTASKLLRFTEAFASYQLDTVPHDIRNNRPNSFAPTMNVTMAGTTFNLIIDTGSSALVLTDSRACHTKGVCGCRTYTDESHPLPCAQGCKCDDLLSETPSCTINVSYADGSHGWGPMNIAELQMGHYIAKQTAVGALTEQWKLCNKDYDGILGVAYRPLNCQPQDSKFCPLTVMDQLLNQNGYDNIFSLWVGSHTTGGVVTLGGYDDTLYVGPIRWAPVTFAQYYSVNCHSMAIDNRLAVERNETSFGTGTIVDSGTTLIQLSTAAYISLKEMFLTYYSHCHGVVGQSNIWDNELELNATSLACYPPLHFYIDDIVVSVSPRGYFRDLNVAFVFGIQEAKTDFSVLGNVLMSAFYVVFQRENASIGFADVKPTNLPPAPPVKGPAQAPPADLTSLPDWVYISGGVSCGVFIILGVITGCSFRRKVRNLRTRVVLENPPEEFAPPYGNHQTVASPFTETSHLISHSRRDYSTRQAQGMGSINATQQSSHRTSAMNTLV